jgi:hypothetical protein
MTPTPSPTEARERLAKLATLIVDGELIAEAVQYTYDTGSYGDDKRAMVADLRALLAEREALLAALKPFAAAWEAVGSAWLRETSYRRNGKRTSMQARIEPEDFRRAAALLNPDPLPETAEGDAP